MAAKPIRIAIIANAAQAKRELNGFSSGLSSSFKKVGKVAAVGAAVAGAALLKFGVDSVKAASDAQQSLGATETVFGKFADTVIKTSEKAATKYGLSANQYRESANLIGSLFRNQGVAVGQLAGKTQEMVGIGTDLAATFGGTTAEAVEALGSAFKGEFDTLEKYGISLKQAEINAAASSLAQKKYGKSLEDLSTKQQAALKQQATSNAIMQQSARTRGAFARETDTLAHQQQVLAAQFENVKVKIGNVLLPILTKVFSFLNAEAIPAITEFGEKLGTFLAPYVDKAKAAFESLMESLQPVTDWFASHPEIIKGIGIALGIAAGAALAFAAAMGVVAIATSPITLVVLAVAALGGAIAYAYKNSETFRNVLSAVGRAVVQFGGWLKSNLMPVLQALGAYYVALFQRLRSITSTVLGVIKSLWSVFGSTITNFLRNTFQNLKTIVQGGLKVIRGIIQTVTAIIKGDWSGAWNGIKTILSGAWAVIRGLVSQGVNVVKSLMSAAWAALKALTSAAWNGIKSAVSSAISGLIGLVRGIPGKITSALGNLGSLLYNAGKSIIQGLIDGVTGMIGSLQDKFNSITNMIPDWKGPKAKDKRLLRPTGKWIMEGLIKGLDEGSTGVEKFLGNLTDKIEKALKAKGFKGKALTKGLKSWVFWLKQSDDALRANARAQDKNAERLKAAREALKDIVAESKDFARNIKQGIVAMGDITGLGKNEDGSVSISNLIDQLKDKVVAAQRFNVLMQQLAAQGLNQTAIQQMLSAGPEAALATAEAIASGGAAAISEINSLQSQLAQTGTQLGNAMADEFFSAGIKAAEGLVKGLEKEAKNLDKAAIRLANALVKAVKKALGIKSPSKVFEAIGDNVTKGLVIGLDEYRIKKAGESLSGALTTGFGEPALDAMVAASASQKSQVAVTLTAEQVSALEQGRKIALNLDTYYASGGRRKAS